MQPDLAHMVDSDVKATIPGIGAVGVTVEWECSTPEFVPLVCSCCFRVRVKQVECGDRTCGPCGSHRVARFKARWVTSTDLFNRGGIFLTLTIPNVFGRLKQRVRELRSMWRKLRRSKSLRALRGGWYAIEVTQGKSLGWNLHLHVLAWGTQGVPLQAVRTAWRRVGGGVWIHASPVRSPKHAQRYMAKEISKGLRGISSGEELHAEVARGLKGTRLLQSFGDLEPPIEAEATFCDECGGMWQYFGSEDQVPADAILHYDEQG